MVLSRNNVYANWLKNDNRPVAVDVSCMVYNHGPYLRQALDGILMQKTCFPVRLIIHDDASTDDSTSIIREYTKRYPDRIISVIEDENQYQQGKSLWKIMFPYFTAKYIACCEGDDYWTDPDKLQKQVDYLERNPDCVAVYHNILPVDENGVYDESRRGSYRLLKEGDYTKHEIRMIRVKNQTASMVRRNYYPCMSEQDKEVFAEAKCCLDRKNFILCGLIGRVHYFSDVMAAHRVVFEHGDSWTATQCRKTDVQRVVEANSRFLENCRLYEYFSGKRLYPYNRIISRQLHIMFRSPGCRVNLCKNVPLYAYIIYVPVLLFRIVRRLFGRKTHDVGRLYRKFRTVS